MRRKRRVFQRKPSRFSRITNLKNHSRLSVLVLIRIRILIGILVLTKRAHRAKTLTITLASVYRFEFCLLSGRNEVRVFFQILDNLFGYHFALEAAQRTFDIFVVVD